MEIPVEVSLTYPVSSEIGKRASLRVRDRTSNVILVDVLLAADELLDFLSTSLVEVKALAKVSDNLERVGREMEGATINIGPVDGFYGDDVPPVVSERAATLLTEGWDSAEPRPTKGGWKIVVRRWRAKA